MSLGRSVPWSCWEEWQQVGEWLQSKDASAVQKGLDRVATWRSRGRVPLGVDSTASFVETRLSDESGTLSQLPLRMQYSLAVVRMVNGIADSSQKGRMAASVARLTAAAGLPRLLVDLRHEATHNELPSLAALQLAAHHALTWLRTNYWQKQKDHVELNKAKISGIIGDYVGSHLAAAIKAAAATQKQDYDSDDEDEEEKDNGSGGGGNTKNSIIAGDYNVAEARKQRQALLTELRVAVPAPATYLLIDGLLQAQITASEESPSAVVVRALTHSMKHLLQEGWSQLPALILDTAAVALGNIENSSSSNSVPQAPASVASVADWTVWLEVLAPEEKVDVSENAARSIIATALLSLSEIEQAPLNRWLKNSLSAPAVPATAAEKNSGIAKIAARELDTQRASNLKRLLEVTLSRIEDKDLKQRCLAVAAKIHLNASNRQPGVATKGQPNVQVVAELQRLGYEVLDLAGKGTQGTTSTSGTKRPRSMEDSSQYNSEQAEKINNKKSQQRWSKCINWQPCAIGMLPSAVDSNGKIPRLELKNGLQLCELPKEDAVAALGIETTAAGGFGGGGGGGAAAVAMTLEDEEDEEEQLNGNSDDNTAEDDDMLEEEEDGPPPTTAASGRCPPPSAVRPQI